MFQVSHFVKLVAGGDPRMIELLFCHHGVAVKEEKEWKELTQHKQSFVCLEMARKCIHFFSITV